MRLFGVWLFIAALLVARAAVNISGNTKFLGNVQIGSMRAADFNPNQLTNLILWWEGDMQWTNNGQTNNAPVTKYYDLTVHLNHGYTNNETPPKVITNQLNGHSIVFFTNSGFYFVTTNALSNMSQGELWAVLKPENDPQPNEKAAIWNFAQNAGVQGNSAWPTTTLRRNSENFFSWITYDFDSPNVMSNAYHIISIFVMTNQMILALDGQMIAGGNNIIQGCITNPTVGKGTSTTPRWAGRLADLFIFEYFNSELNRSNMLGYLTNKYALPIVTNTFAVSAVDTNFWSPTNFTSSMHTWVCATNFNGQTNDAMVGTNGNFWTDQSGHGNHWTNVTLTSMPLFHSNVFGALPAVNFDVANDTLFCINQLLLQNTNDISITMMFASSNTSQRPLFGNPSVAVYCKANSSGLNVPAWVSTNTVQPNNGEFQNTNTTPQVMVLQRTNGVWQIWRNMEIALDYSAGPANANNVDITSMGFRSDFGVGMEASVHEFWVITNRTLASWDIINLYRFYHKAKNTALP